MRISDWSSDVCSSDLDGPADLGGAAGSCHHRRLEEVRHLRGYPGSDEDPRFVDLMLVEKLAIGGGDAADAERDDRDTLLRDGSEGAGHVDEPYFGGAKHHRGMNVDLRRDAETLRHVGDGAEADGLAELGGDGIDRSGEGLADRHRARIAARAVAWAPAVDADRLVDDGVARHEPCFQRRDRKSTRLNSSH